MSENKFTDIAGVFMRLTFNTLLSTLHSPSNYCTRVLKGFLCALGVTEHNELPAIGVNNKSAAWKRWLGKRSEQMAERHLCKAGYSVIARNVRDSHGELDIVAVTPDRKTVVVVEVRSVAGTCDTQKAVESVTYRKQQKITETTLRFLGLNDLHGVHVRYDIVAIAWPDVKGKPIINHLPHAFVLATRDRYHW